MIYEYLTITFAVMIGLPILLLVIEQIVNKIAEDMPFIKMRMQIERKYAKLRQADRRERAAYKFINRDNNKYKVRYIR